MKSYNLLICNLYILFWVLYNFHWQNVGSLFPVLDKFSNFFLGVNLIISLACTIKVFIGYKFNVFFKITFLVVLMFIIYGSISIFLDEPIILKTRWIQINKGTYLVGALRTFLPIYTFFLFSKMGYITEKIIKIWFWIFLAQTLLIFYSSRLILGLDTMSDIRTNNSAYLFVVLFPFIVFYDKRYCIKYILVLLFAYLTVISIKRGAILILSLEIIYLLYFDFLNANVKKRIMIVLFSLIFVFVAADFISDIYNESSTFQKRIDKTLEGNMSGRDSIAENLLNIYLNSNLLNLLFGYGADATLKLGNNYAHNDWLEILINQGLFGFVYFSIFWWAFYKLWRKEAHKKSPLTLLLGLLFICSFPKSLFSMWYSMTSLYVTLPLGYCLAKIDSDIKLKR